MTPDELAAIVARDAASDLLDCEACREYRAGPAEADRRALLALLRETRRTVKMLDFEFGLNTDLNSNLMRMWQATARNLMERLPE